MRASHRRLTLAALAAFACGSEPEGPPTPALSISGVVTHEGEPLRATTVLPRLFDSLGNGLGEDSAVTDSDGRFSIRLELDTLVTHAYLSVSVTPPFGSGLLNAFFDGNPAFDATGSADTALVFVVERWEPAVPSGPPTPLDPGHLAGRYYGETVAPYGLHGGVYLTLEIDSATAAGPFGRFDISFTASTSCGSGQGPIEGSFSADTMHLRIRADPAVQDFLVTSYDAANDTLIVGYPPAPSGDCPWGTPAPIRLVRQGEP